MDSRQREAQLSAAVRDYISAHPFSMDTAEGIANWWMRGTGAPVPRRMLIRVLDRLVQEGVLEKIGSGPNALYRRMRSV
ncbi:hypothetical protein [Caballeronia sp. J97]|uniref:hypothetical protein n=1 Tax=Caballeronia sp. J97 TaxID=2805429 RepID=UPI002AAFFEA6|nr:hypothetical protein [Caballeronia sp. J97]